MRKGMTIVLFCLMTFKINAENEFNSYKYSSDLKNWLFNDGYVYMLNYELGLSHLVNFSKEELRILRNYYYAKYNYSFSSTDLINFFTKFKWYSAKENNVDNKLTEIDKKSIQLIQEVENNISSDNDVRKVIGVWRLYGAVPDQGYTWGDYIIMYQNGIYERKLRNFNAIRYGNIITGGSIYGIWTTKNTSSPGRNKITISELGKESNGHDQARINNQNWWRVSENVLNYEFDWGSE